MNAAVGALATLGRFARFCAVGTAAIPMARGSAWRALCWEMFAGSILVTLAVTAFSGAMLTVQGFASLTSFGTPELLGMFVSLSGVREVFPLIGAGCVGAKLGSAMAAELATMRLGQQVDALEVMAVDPVTELVAPRLLAATVVTPLLVGLGLMGGLFASYLVATYQLGVDPGGFLARALDVLTAKDILAGLTKGTAFGALTGALACFHGLEPARGPGGVGDAANRTVVQAMVVGAVVNLLISHLFYGGLS